MSGETLVALVALALIVLRQGVAIQRLTARIKSVEEAL